MSTSKRSIKRKQVSLVTILTLLVSASITLGVGPSQLLPRKADSPEKSSATEVFNTFPAALLKPYRRLINPTVLVNFFTVTTTADNGSNTSPTPGSLREAIINANNSGGGTINFSIPN